MNENLIILQCFYLKKVFINAIKIYYLFNIIIIIILLFNISIRFLPILAI